MLHSAADAARTGRESRTISKNVEILLQILTSCDERDMFFAESSKGAGFKPAKIEENMEVELEGENVDMMEGSRKGKKNKNGLKRIKSDQVNY
ncbi:hypothetical protein J2Z49_002901 [Desulfofundulus luciae]|uniref:Uncharacterized protein n=1 Tax=Desulfofundulus luciae TaxID=74702 RepID=A0ABU0B682_9FIRM|nr:hypothetical protein [Desulfofundulus luciae]